MMPTITKRLLSVNFAEGRTAEIEGIVIHVMEGTIQSARSWFNADVSNVSAHYGIGKDGAIDQYVEESDTAWHAGRVLSPTAQIVRDLAGNNPNSYTIGIEHEGSGRDPLTSAQRASSVWLIREIAKRHPRVKLDRYHIVGHHEIYAGKTCPGAIDVDALVKEAAATAPVPAPTPSTTPKPTIVWSQFFNDWLIVTRVVNDDEWYFLRSRNLRSQGERAQTPLSHMPTQP